MNRKQRRGKPQGLTFSDMLARKKMMKECVQQAANDTTVEVMSKRALQRGLWLSVVSVSDAFGIGPDRMKKFFEVYQKNTDELQQMISEVDEDYGYEKLRKKAEKVCGTRIIHLYEDESNG